MQNSIYRRFSSMSRCFLRCTFIIGITMSVVLNASATQDNKSNEIKREIFVPFDDLDVLLDRNSNRVMLERKEYEKILKAARTREIKRAPLDSVIVSARYEGHVIDGVAVITGELIVESLNEGLVAVPLSLSGVALRRAQLDDEAAKLWRDDKGQIVLLVSGAKRRTLTLQMTAPMQTTAARQSLSLQLPTSGVAEFHLTVPGNVEVKSGLPVAKRIFSEHQNETRFDLLIGRSPISLTMSLNNRLLKDEQVVVARSVLIHKLSLHEQQIHVTCSMDVIHGAVERVQFKVPDGFQVSQVNTELLSQWEIKETNEGKVLSVQLLHPTRDGVVLNIVADRTVETGEDWTAARFQPMDVAGHVAVLGILADVSLQLENIESQGVIPIDHEFLAAAIPASTLAAGFSGPMAMLAAFYAPQSTYSITAKLDAPEPRLVVKSNSRLVVDDSYLELQGGISLLSTYDSRIGFDIELPARWRFIEITGTDGKPVEFERSQSKTGTRVHVRLRQRIGQTKPTRVYFKARSTPTGWLDSWKENNLVFPGLTVLEATTHTGSVAVSIQSDFQVIPMDIDGLETLNDQDKQKFDLQNDATPLAFQFKSNKYKLNLQLERLLPSINARTYTFYRVEPTELVVHSELVFDVRQAKTDTFRFQLPKSSPASISIRGTDNRLKDFFSTETATHREWIVQFSETNAGTIGLVVDYRQPLDEKQLAELVLVPVAVNDVAFQSAMMAVEGSAELDIEIKTEGRVVDIGEMSEATYQPGRYILGAFSWPSASGKVIARSTRRPIYVLPSAIVQRAEMITSLSTTGKAQTAARFQLVTKLPFLRIRLPAGSSLWSVLLDGKAAKPLVDGESMLVSLFGSESNTLRDLRLVYQSDVESIGLFGNVVADAPSLWLHDSTEAQGLAVPLVDLQWRLVLPDGYRVSYVDKNFQSKQIQSQQTSIQRLGSWFCVVGGGFGHADENAAIRHFSGEMMVPPGEMAGEEDDEFRPLRLRRGHSLLPDLKADAKDDANENGVRDLTEAEKKIDLDGVSKSQSVSAPPTHSVPQTDGDSDKRNTARQWALGGLRSLNIELTETGNAINFYSLGEQPRLRATVVNNTRVMWLAVAIALLTGLVGILLTGRSTVTKIRFVMAIILVACLLPLTGSIFDAFRPVADLALLAAVLTGLYFVVAAMLVRFGISAKRIAVRLPVGLIVVLSGLAVSQSTHAQKVVNDTDQLRNLIERLHHTTPIELPTDAIIIPFDAADPDGREKANRLLLPYKHYIQLISDAENHRLGDGEISSPVDFVLSSAEYSTQLTFDEDLTVEGKIVIELMTDKPIAVALPFNGGALADARVNGQSAKLQFAAANKAHPATSGQPTQTHRDQPSSNVVLLHLEGRGQKAFEFTVHLGLKRHGGWRSVNARLPVGLTRAINITTLDEETEIKLLSDSGQRSIDSEAGDTIETVLSADGRLRLQWKPSTAAQAIDQSLTVESEAVFDIREDGLRLAWRVALDFRGSERDSFTLIVPSGFLVEGVTGENIRAWDIKEIADGQQLDVNLLSATKTSESFTVELSQRSFSVTQQMTEVETPCLTVVGAALERGVLTIRRSPIIELKTLNTKSAQRIDLDPSKCLIDIKAIDAAASPLGILTYQTLRFATTPFTFRLGANLLAQSIEANTQTILRVGQSEAGFETRINYQIGPMPIYELSFDLPKSVEIGQVTAGQNESWSIEGNDLRQRVHLFFPKGIKGGCSVFVDGSIPDFQSENEWDVAMFRIVGADSQDGEIAVQVDPALNVTAVDLRDCETVLLNRLNDWLNPDQRSSSRLALRTHGADCAATLKFSRIEPRVTVETATNVRLTYFAIEETILLDFEIQQAGIRQVKFMLPKSLEHARIRAQLVSETKVEPAAAPDDDMVMVTLNLQDSVMGSYRVVVENDRQLADQNLVVPIPVSLVGETTHCYATLQNAGRDEIEVTPSSDFQPLHRQLRQYANLKQKLGGGQLTMAYLAKQDIRRPRLVFGTKVRKMIDTVTASIEFSKTVMVVDSGGAYRAVQTFQINNQSEQYLDIRLPARARLLTVWVEGAPVKPVKWPASGDGQRLRVPLVKTPLGDLDYPVQLKYAGQLGDLSLLKKIEFPVVETININVQLSQLQLRLPESYRWVNFDGTMTKVTSQGELEEDFLSYKGQQIQQLSEQIRSEAAQFGSFSKSRALRNLQILEMEMNDYETTRLGVDIDMLGQISEKVESQIVGNQRAIREVQRAAELDKAEETVTQFDNRANFNELLVQQKSKIARNSVIRQGKNWKVESGYQVAQDQDRIQSKSKFDLAWFARNKLETNQQEINAESRANEEPGTQFRDRQSLGRQLQSGKASGAGQEIMLLDKSISFANPQEQFGEILIAKMQNRKLPNPTDRFESGRRRGGGLGGVGSGIRGLGEDTKSNAVAPDLSIEGDVHGNGATGTELASLQIELPERGVNYYFKSPRGKALVTARPILEQTVGSWATVLATIILIFSVLVFWRVARSIGRYAAGRTLGFTVLTLFGLISIGTDTLPIYGVVALATAVAIFSEFVTRIIVGQQPASNLSQY